MRLSLFAAAAVLAPILAAHADTYQIAITSGSDYITFDVPSSPVNPQQTGSGGFELNGLTFNYDGSNMTGDVAFYPTTAPYPGIEAQVGLNNFFATEGIQVFTGTIQHPTFSLASFTSTNTIGLAGATATVNITDLTPTSTSVTPEPSSIALLSTAILGMAGIVRKRFA